MKPCEIASDLQNGNALWFTLILIFWGLRLSKVRVCGKAAGVL